MSGLFESTTNYSFYAVPAAWLIAFLPHAYAAASSKSFDNRSPRTYSKCLEKDQTLDNATKDMIIRCEGAQSNGFENLAFFATGVLAGNLAGLPASTLNGLTGAYLASRVLYNFIYITNTSEAVANVRSVVFISGVGLICTLFIKAGNVLKDRSANLI